VHAFPGHIACDSASLSELVVPLINNGKVMGVLDLDSPKVNRFTEQDEKELTKIMQLLIPRLFPAS
jgi:L-methionine (R)-S-oxide reductase